MSFSTDVSELSNNIKFSFSTGDIISTPTPQDVFFRSKQWEIIEQYQMARIFLINAEVGDYKDWLGLNDLEYIEDFKLKYQATMFESALIYYNIIIDLSWVLCYASAEHTLYQDGKAIKNLSSAMNIEDAYELYRQLESSVSEPNDKNPLIYLSYVSKEFSSSIDLVMNFWKQICNEKVFNDGSTIRSLYNFIKHRGKPLYNEFEKLMGQKLMGLYIGDIKCPSDIRDLQKKIELHNSIIKLKSFDDELLFPYIKKLLLLVENSLKPSKFV